jgi:small subunit ribosomal protein S7
VLLGLLCHCDAVTRRDAFRARKELGSGLKLARELADLEGKSGAAFKRREDMHRLAEANRAYSHFLR